MPALRLSHKLFLAFALLTGVVLSLAGWSLLTTRRLTAENRAIIERALPSVRLEIGDPGRGRRASPRGGSPCGSPGSCLPPALRRAGPSHRERSRRAGRPRVDGGGAPGARERGRAAPQLPEPWPSGRRREPRRRAGRDRGSRRWPSGSTGIPAPSSGGAAPRRGASRSRAGSWRCSRSSTSLLVSLAIAGFASLRIARPLTGASSRGVGRRAAQGHRAHPVRGRDEIAELTIAFNRMADRLRELDTLKQHLFSAITHDLRTPLTVIAWSAERLGTRRGRHAARAPGVTRREHPDEHGPALEPGHASSSISASSGPASSSSISIPPTSTP